MRFKEFITESSVDGMSKQKIKNMIYKRTSNITRGFYKDEHWKGVNAIWDVFNDLDLDWHVTKSEYLYDRMGSAMKRDMDQMPNRKEWQFQINWKSNKGRDMKMGGVVTASGAGSVQDPLEKYDVTLVLW